MRRNRVCGLATVLTLLIPAVGGRAQQGYYNRVNTARGAVASASTSGRYRADLDTGRDRDPGEDDPLRPYGSRASGRTPDRGYAREPIATPRVVPQAPAATRNHDYFPGLRSGQSPNRNYVPPHHLCVPGRRAFIYSR